MGVYLDWFLADESEAEAVASIASEEGHEFEDWPHLAMKGVGDVDLMLLRGILLGRPDDIEDADGDALYHESEDGESGVSVTRIRPAFLGELAALSPAEIERAGGEWHRREEMADRDPVMANWDPGTVVAMLGEMAEFARRAQQEDKPVLQLSVW